MSLLRDIQNAAISLDTDVSTLLRMCKVLAVRLGNTEFESWVDNELNGYPNKESLPQYRKLNVQSFGHFSGLFGKVLKNAPIPSSCIPKEFRDVVTTSYLIGPISKYTFALNEPDSEYMETWPSDLVVRYGNKIYQDMNCINAWKFISQVDLVALADTIKTRILNFCLKIEKESPNVGESSQNDPPMPQEKVNQFFNTYITGNVQNVSAGGQNFSQSATMSSGVCDQLFENLLAEVQKAKAESDGLKEIVAAIGDMRIAHGTKDFSSQYRKFMGVLADHIQVFGPAVAPYLPQLAALVSRCS
jgi:hypothetical protein